MAGRYRLETVLGRGGTGQVWRATDESAGRLVAVKELRPPAELPAWERTALRGRALREAEAARRITHPGVVTVHDVVTAGDAVYLVMELVDAPTLAEVVARERALPQIRVAAIGVRVLQALAATHAAGVVHRDVKPLNVMVLPRDEVKLVDLGIARGVDDTRRGLVGATGYLAPELFHGLEPSPAADLWSVGVTLFHAVSGRGPFDRESTAATVHAVLHANLPVPPCGEPLAAVLTGLLHRDPAQRMTGDRAIAVLRSVPTIRVHPDATAPAQRPAPPATSRTAMWGKASVFVAGVVALTLVLLLVQPEGTPTAPSAARATALGPLPGALALHEDKANPVLFGPDGRLLVTGASGGVQLWSLADPAEPAPVGQVPHSPPAAHSPVPVALRADGGVLAVVDRATVALWDITDPAHPVLLGTVVPEEFATGLDVLAFRLDGRVLAVGTTYGEVELWDVADPANAAPIGGRANLSVSFIDSMVFGRDGNTVLVAESLGGTVLVLDATRPEGLAAAREANPPGPDTAVLSPDGRWFATGRQGEAQLWTASGAVGPVLAKDGDGPMAFGPDGRTLVTASGADGVVELWQVPDTGVATSAGTFQLPGFTGTAEVVVVGPDSTIATVDSASNAVSLWRMTPTGR